VGRSPGQNCRYADECPSGLPQVENEELTYRQLRILWGLLYGSPGIPLLYYGDEFAQPGGNDPDNRRPLSWARLEAGSPSPTLTEKQRAHFTFMQSLGRARSQHTAFHGTQRFPLVLEDDIMVFARRHETAWALVIAAKSPTMRIDVPLLDWMGQPGAMSTIVGDGQLIPHETGWSFESGESGITYFVPEERP